MASVEGRHVLITGANTGIGRTAAHALAGMGATVILACRNQEKTQPVIDEIARSAGPERVHFLRLDLASFDSVRNAAQAVIDAKWPVSVLINNAGLAGHHGETAEGFEIHFGTNHLGHFLFTNLLLDALKASAPARIINVASGSHYQTKKLDFDLVKGTTRSRTGLSEYAVSKLANVLFTTELARRLEGSGVTTYALHPGVVASDAWRRVPWPLRSAIKLFMISVEAGAKTTVYCATSEDVVSGRYYDSCAEKRPSRLAQDEALAKVLWEKSAEWVGL